jgi:transcriptional regulator with XRE-family HTH domain
MSQEKKMDMNLFEELLKEARKRSGLSQQALADKVGVDDSYISKMENRVDKPPSRVIAVKLANALGLRKKSRRRLEFLLAAGVTSEEDLEGFKLVEVEDGEAEEEEDQASGRPIYSTAHSAIGIPDSLLGTIGDQIKEIGRLIDSLSLTDEEEEMVASQLDTTERLLKFIAAQRNMRKEG